MEILKKSELRSRMKELRSQLDTDTEISMNKAIWNQLRNCGNFKTASCVFCYIDYRHEAGTGEILQYLWKHRIPVAVPRISGKHMSFFYIHSYRDLVPGCMGIPEPDKHCEKAICKNSPVIVPGVAFDRRLCRLGYGGGYYDRFFENEPDHHKIGIAFDFQVFPEIPSEPFDKMMDGLVTPSSIIVRGGEL